MHLIDERHGNQLGIFSSNFDVVDICLQEELLKNEDSPSWVMFVACPTLSAPGIAMAFLSGTRVCAKL